MSKPANKNLIRKLTEACNAVGGVEKKGRNEFQRYNYVKAADVAKAIRHELFERRILLTCDEKEITEKDVPTNNGGTIRVLTLKVEYTLRDGDSAETLTMTAFGVAMDSGDKAIYKAKTGALKYFLRTLGIIPDERDDPEFDESVDEFTDERVTAPPSFKGKAKKVAEFQMRAFHSACDKSGKTESQKASYLKEKFNVGGVADLTKEQFTDAIKWALGTEDLAETVKLSTDAAARKKANGAVEGKPEPVYEAI